MTANKRIFLNIVATYGRSLFAIACGLFSGRWTLMALGEVDYGLFGVVGGLTAFISFFNSVLAYSVSRFYATSVGYAAGCANHRQGLDECRKWFSIAVVVHTALPTMLMLIGYPIGEWAVRHYLTIPTDRVEMCVSVFRLVCVSCFLSMVTVPYNAMYQAKQYIAELTIYSVVSISANICFVYYMVSHPGVWLVKYAFWYCFLTIAPMLCIAIRGAVIFPECRFSWKYIGGFKDIRSLFSYTGWQLFGSFGCLFRGQATQILVNKYCGPAINSAMSMAGTVSGHTGTLSGALIGAFQPAISNAFGAGDKGRFLSLSYRACKFGMLCMLIFTLPLAVELREVMVIWLKNPPQYVTEFCWGMLAVGIVTISTIGHDLAINASGRVARYQIINGSLRMSAFPVAWLFFSLFGGPLWIVPALLLTAMSALVACVIIAQGTIQMSITHWIFGIVIPIVVVSIVAGAVGFLPRLLMEASFLRVIVTTIFVETVFLPLIWLFVLDNHEREKSSEVFRRMMGKVFHPLREKTTNV